MGNSVCFRYVVCDVFVVLTSIFSVCALAGVSADVHALVDSTDHHRQLPIQHGHFCQRLQLSLVTSASATSAFRQPDDFGCLALALVRLAFNWQL